MSGRILIVAAAATSRALLRTKLEAAYYEVCSAAGVAGALEVLPGAAPDGIILEVSSVAEANACGDLVAAAGSDPFVFVTVPRDRADLALDAVSGGADDFLMAPFAEPALLARVRAASKRRGARAPWGPSSIETAGWPGQLALGHVGIVAQTHQAAAEAREILAPWASRITTGLRAAAISQAVPEVCLIWERLAGGKDGLRLIAALQERTEVLCVLDAERPGAALDAGASDFIAEPFEAEALVARMHLLLRRKRQREGLRNGLIEELRLASTDPLTGLANRRRAVRVMEAHRAGGLSVVMLDIDRFKQINDRFGHQAGDAVLQGFAARLAGLVGPEDLVARYGGEEFLAILPGAGADAARVLAERLRAAIAAEPFAITDRAGGLEVTVSLGVATALGAAESPEAIIARADRALYASKAGGRNRVTLHSDAA